ncbi:MAG: 30S ribosomal protein S17 [Candidatus Gottesmanbacteria bacterium]
MATTAKQTVSKGKEFTGKIVSKKMNKTVVVEITHMQRHPLYRKATRITKRFLVHAEQDTYAIGDTVTIIETRPISRLKHFMVKA